MAEDNDSTVDDGTDWIVPPPAPGTAGFVFRPGEGFALSEEGAEALQTLAAELGEQDSEGFMLGLNAIFTYDCKKDGSCRPKSCRIMI